MAKRDEISNRFYSAEGISQYAHGNQTYKVIKGIVALPAEAWVTDMVEAGILTPVPAKAAKTGGEDKEPAAEA